MINHINTILDIINVTNSTIAFLRNLEWVHKKLNERRSLKELLDEKIEWTVEVSEKN